MVSRANKIWTLAVASLLLADWERLHAAPLPFIYNGRLSASDGKSVSGPISIEVGFYRSKDATVPLDPGLLNYTNISLKEGTFSLWIALSGSDFHKVFPSFQDEVWIEIKDVTHNKVYPRQTFSAVPFASSTPVDGKTVLRDNLGRISFGPQDLPLPGQFLTQDSDGRLIWAFPPTAGTVLQGKPINESIPNSGEILRYDGSKWVSSPLSLGTGSVSALTASAPFAVTNSTTTPQVSMGAASSVSDGHLTAADFAIFQGKQNALGYTPLDKAGDTLLGTLNMGGKTISNLDDATNPNDALNRKQVDDQFALYAKQDGSARLTGDWNAGPFAITGVNTFQSSSIQTSARAGISLEPFAATAGSTGEVHFQHIFTGANGYVGFKAPDSVTANVIWTLPAADGAVGERIRTNGSGQLSWVGPDAGVGAVTSINGKNGVVTLDTDELPAGTNVYFSANATKAAAVANSISNGVTDVAPSHNAVFDALALKANTSAIGTMAAKNSVATGDITDGTIVSADVSGTAAIADTKLATIATAGKVSDSALSANVTKLGSDISLATAETTGVLPVGNGGLDLSATPTNGQIPIGNGTNYTLATLTAGTGMTVTNAAGTITLSTTENAANKLDIAGGTMTGSIDMGGTHKVTNLLAPDISTDAANKLYVDTKKADYVKSDASVSMTGNWNTGAFAISGIKEFSATSTQTSGQAAFTVNPSGGAVADVRFKESSVITNQYVALRGPDSITANKIWTLPAADGTNGQVLTTNGSGQLVWASQTAFPVTSVAGKTGAVTLTTTDLTQGSTNTYFTAALTKTAAVSNTLTNGVTDVAPSQEAVFEAAALKVDSSALGTLAPKSAIDSADITNDSIVNADISATAAIADTKLATISTAGKVSDSALSANVTLLGSAVDLNTSEVTNTLPVANGGTGNTTAAADGKLLIGNGTGYALANLTAGTNTTITNGNGTITIAGNGDPADKILKAGDTMTGALVLPSNGLTVGTTQLKVANSHVGVGVSPDANSNLDVRGTDTVIQARPALGSLYPLAGLTAGPSLYLGADNANSTTGPIGGLEVVVAPSTPLFMAGITRTAAGGNIVFNNSGTTFFRSGQTITSMFMSNNTLVLKDALYSLYSLNFPATLGNKISFHNNSSTTMFGLGIQAGLFQFYSRTAASDYIRFGAYNGSTFNENLRIRGDGGVGLGTNGNPTKRLEVKTATDNDGMKIFANSNQWFGLYTNTTAGAFSNTMIQAGDRALIWGGASAAAGPAAGFVIGPWSGLQKGLRLTSDGKLGINIEAPSEALHISQGLKTTSGSNTLHLGTCPSGATCPYSYETLHLSTSNFRIYFGTTQYYRFGSDGVAERVGGTSWSSTSDERLKDIKGPYKLGLATIMRLNPIVFSYKKDNAMGAESKREWVGFSAQNVQEEIPDAIYTNEKGYLTIRPDYVRWATLNAIKEEYAARRQAQEELDKSRLDRSARRERLKAENAELQLLIDAKSTEIQMMKHDVNELRQVLCKGPDCGSEDQ